MFKSTTTARKEFAALAEAAGASFETLLKQAADNAVNDGEAASADITHDEAVIEAAKLRISRSQAALKKATYVLKLVKSYVS